MSDTPTIIEASELRPKITSITTTEEEEGPLVPRITSAGELTPAIVSAEEEE